MRMWKLDPLKTNHSGHLELPTVHRLENETPANAKACLELSTPDTAARSPYGNDQPCPLTDVFGRSVPRCGLENKVPTLEKSRLPRCNSTEKGRLITVSFALVPYVPPKNRCFWECLIEICSHLDA